MSEMDVGQLANVIQSAVAAGTIIVLMLKLWPSHRVDEFRQAMFAVRDELFDFAAKGGGAFSHPAHRLLRQSMNGFIRYGHQLTLFRLICNLVRWKLHDEHLFTWADGWDAALGSIADETAKQALRDYHDRTLTIVVKRLVTGSPVLMAMLAGLILIAMVRTQWGNLRQLASASAMGMVNHMFDSRFLEEEASRA